MCQKNPGNRESKSEVRECESAENMENLKILFMNFLQKLNSSAMKSSTERARDYLIINLQVTLINRNFMYIFLMCGATLMNVQCSACTHPHLPRTFRGGFSLFDF